MEFSDILDIIPSIDILVYTSDEFKALIADPSQGFWKSVKSTLVQYIEKAAHNGTAFSSITKF